jgi:hypothetical protein
VHGRVAFTAQMSSLAKPEAKTVDAKLGGGELVVAEREVRQTSGAAHTIENGGALTIQV